MEANTIKPNARLIIEVFVIIAEPGDLAPESLDPLKFRIAIECNDDVAAGSCHLPVLYFRGTQGRGVFEPIGISDPIELVNEAFQRSPPYA